MGKETTSEILNRFRAEVESQGIRIDKLIVFGSCAAGNYREDSDIDVMVVSSDFVDKGYWERLEILSQAIYAVFEPIEAIAMTPEEWETGDSLIVSYAKDGILV